VLAAVARETQRIRLTSTVSVLSSADPVRLFEEFATLDLLSGGRAEITAGRGAYVESFPLFGQDLGRYDEYFEDRLGLLLAVRDGNPVTWSGSTRPPLVDAGVWPRPLQERLPVWIAVGGTPASVVRAGSLGLPLALAIIGGLPERFAPLVTLYRDAAGQAGHDPAEASVLRVHGFGSLVMLPLLIQDNVWGLVEAYRHDTQRPFTDAEVRTAAEISRVDS